ncbi:hypothetical protein MN608_07720 [Microdochium nivale]|nr:hypothetical protein MN608_07720 [Microdochium nivale]
MLGKFMCALPFCINDHHAASTTATTSLSPCLHRFPALSRPTWDQGKAGCQGGSGAAGCTYDNEADTALRYYSQAHCSCTEVDRTATLDQSPTIANDTLSTQATVKASLSSGSGF